MSFYRSDKNILYRRIANEPRRFIQVIYGPRQVGKTTLVRQVMKELDYPSKFVAADAVPAGDHAWINQQWEAARLQQSKQADKPLLLVIDEVQKSITGVSKSKQNGIKTVWKNGIFDWSY